MSFTRARHAAQQQQPQPFSFTSLSSASLSASSSSQLEAELELLRQSNLELRLPLACALLRREINALTAGHRGIDSNGIAGNMNNVSQKTLLAPATTASENSGNNNSNNSNVSTNNSAGHQPQAKQATVVTEKVRIPVDEFPNYNFVGRILGPRGQTLKRMEKDTGCRILIRGSGSTRNKRNEDRLRNKRGYEHLNEPLHLVIEAPDQVDGTAAAAALAKTRQVIGKLLTPLPDEEDEVKRTQLRELRKLNSEKRVSPAAVSETEVAAAGPVDAQNAAQVQPPAGPSQGISLTSNKTAIAPSVAAHILASPPAAATRNNALNTVAAGSPLWPFHSSAVGDQPRGPVHPSQQSMSMGYAGMGTDAAPFIPGQGFGAMVPAPTPLFERVEDTIKDAQSEDMWAHLTTSWLGITPEISGSTTGAVRTTAVPAPDRTFMPYNRRRSRSPEKAF